MYNLCQQYCSKQGNPKLTFKNFGYVRVKICSGERYLWRCEKYFKTRCLGKIYTNLNEGNHYVIEIREKHSCMSKIAECKKAIPEQSMLVFDSRTFCRTILSKQRNTKIVFRNYSYLKARACKDERQLWRCDQYFKSKCRAIIYTILHNNEYHAIKRLNEHTCAKTIRTKKIINPKLSDSICIAQNLCKQNLSQQGHIKLVYNNYAYLKVKMCVNQTFLWRCGKYFKLRCPAKIHTVQKDGEHYVIDKKEDHICKSLNSTALNTMQIVSNDNRETKIKHNANLENLIITSTATIEKYKNSTMMTNGLNDFVSDNNLSL